MDLIEKAARALCLQSGQDPDARVPTGKMETIQLGGNAWRRQPVTEPAWHRHIPEVKRLLVLLEALGVAVGDLST